AALAGIPADAPLRGVIHAAGVLDDGALMQQSWPRFERVLGPKVLGAWNLHLLTSSAPLDFFVIFASMAGLLGNRGQANHAAANTFLDGLAHFRRARGLPALSIDWGGWSEIGAAADKMAHERPRLAAQGQGEIAPGQGIRAFAHLLGGGARQIGVIPLDWARFLGTYDSVPPFLSAFAAQDTRARAGAPAAAGAQSMRQQLAEAGPEARRPTLMQYLRTVSAQVLGLSSPQQIGPRQGLQDLGLDSLIAIELRNQIAGRLERPLPSTLLFDYPTLEALADFLLREILSGEEGQAAEAEHQGEAPPPPPGLAIHSIEDLDAISDEDAERLLSEKLDSLEL
ncbi:MAG: KR domain-containing protein, partial [Chloroflexales bacterium]|nr:KR domain-containing protein [Chloroflexales bacterium]